MARTKHTARIAQNKERAQRLKHKKGKKHQEGGEVAEKKPRRWKSGTVAKRNIRKLQKSTKCLIPAAAFARAFRQGLAQVRPDTRVAKGLTKLVQEIVEARQTDILRKSYVVARHAKRITLVNTDVHVARYITEEDQKYGFLESQRKEIEKARIQQAKEKRLRDKARAALAKAKAKASAKDKNEDAAPPQVEEDDDDDDEDYEAKGSGADSDNDEKMDTPAAAPSKSKSKSKPKAKTKANSKPASEDDDSDLEFE